MKKDKKEMVSLALEGDRGALEYLIRSIQDRIYRLSLKMLYHISDSEDATQDILIKIVTRLDSFRQESTFDTWAMKIASNHLQNKSKPVLTDSSEQRQFQFPQLLPKGAMQVTYRHAPWLANGGSTARHRYVIEMRDSRER